MRRRKKNYYTNHQRECERQRLRYQIEKGDRVAQQPRLPLCAIGPKRTYVATSLLYHYGCTDRYPVIEICDVLVPHPETTG